VNTKAYTVPLNPAIFGSDESVNGFSLVNQQSVTWLLTFVRWNVRDTKRTPNADPLSVRDYMIVENDCVQLNVTDSKSTLTPSFQALLKETDINYSDAVHPGDFCFINILTSENDARAVATKVKANQPINEYGDGFKGIFKIQSVRRHIQVDESTGRKTNFYRINGYAFTEFNNTIYFNPNLINQKDLQSQALFTSNVSSTWSQLMSKNGTKYVQELIAFLIQSFIGTGINPKARLINGLVVSPNVQFKVPYLVGRLLGITHDAAKDSNKFTAVIAAKDIYSYIFGIQKYENTGGNVDPHIGLIPSNLQSVPIFGGFFYTNTFCQGNTNLKAEYWNQVKMWSILNQYTNSPLNELFTCFRVSPNGRVMPTLVFRQIPFTSEDFYTRKLGNPADNTVNSIHTTKFLTLPRWKIDSAAVFSADLGTDEAARINFVQYYAKSNINNKNSELSLETARKNYIFDDQDIQKSGLRPYIVQNQFDDTPDVVAFSSVNWARILGDATIGGHLKINGSMTVIGISEPIAIGDNLEFDNVVYHLEQIVHNCGIESQTGIKFFRTELSLSHGVNINSSASGTQYAQMDNPAATQDLTDDFNNAQIYPGISESQDIATRPTNLDLPVASGTPFIQPNLTKGKIGS
jgi:hypothetical protein